MEPVASFDACAGTGGGGLSSDIGESRRPGEDMRPSCELLSGLPHEYRECVPRGDGEGVFLVFM